MTKPNKSASILWDFLMICLSVHHKVKDRKFKTIQDCQNEALSQLRKLAVPSEEVLMEIWNNTCRKHGLTSMFKTYYIQALRKMLEERWNTT